MNTSPLSLSPLATEKPIEIVERELPEIVAELIAMRASHTSTEVMASTALHKTLDLVLEVLTHSDVFGRAVRRAGVAPEAPEGSVGA